MVGEVDPVDVAYGAASQSASQRAVVVEHRHAVPGDPHITLETGGAETQREREGLQGVLRGVRPRAPVGEEDRGIEEGGQALLHDRRSCQPRRLSVVFNLQGGELVIIALLALVVLGPEKLPEAMRHVGRLMRQMRGVRDTFQREFKQALDEPMRDLRRATTGSADELRRAAKSMVEPESDSTSEDAAAESASESEAPVADDASKVPESESVAEPVNSPDAPATETGTGTSEAVDEGEADASTPFEAGQDVDETSAEER